MKAVIVAGGRGQRLQPLTNHIAKPMITIAGKPILEHLINLLKKHKITDLIVCVGYLSESITSYFGNGSQFGVKIKYLYEVPGKPLGTAGAVWAASGELKDDFIVAYADIIRDLNISRMIRSHRKNKPMATINIYKEYDNSPRSRVVFDRKKQIKYFIEHPKGKNENEKFVYSNGSFFILNPNVFTQINHKIPLDFGLDVFPSLLEKGNTLIAYPSSGYFIDIGTPKNLVKARAEYNQVCVKE